jgi:hypothetical protein
MRQATELNNKLIAVKTDSTNNSPTAMGEVELREAGC